MNEMQKIKYTRDKFGCYVFNEPDLKALNLDNCLVIEDSKSVWVFPFVILDKCLKSISWQIHSEERRFLDKFSRLLKNKKSSFLIKGAYVQKNYHFCCKKKMQFATNQCGEHNCRFEQIPGTPFKINLGNCEYVKPIYCDKKFKARRSIYFDELSLDAITRHANKNTLRLRGKRAGSTRSSAEKCGKCIYRNACNDKYAHIKEQCCVTRKMANREMIKCIKKRFKSLDKLERLILLSKKENSILFPYSDKEVIIGDMYNAKKVKLDEDKRFKLSTGKFSSLSLEIQSKLFMFFLAVSLKHDKDWEKGYWGTWLKDMEGINNLVENYKSYEDIIKFVGKAEKENIFKK